MTHRSGWMVGPTAAPGGAAQRRCLFRSAACNVAKREEHGPGTA